MNRKDSICLKEPEQHIRGDTAGRLFEAFFIIIIVIINASASLRERYLSKNQQYILKSIKNNLWHFNF